MEHVTGSQNGGGGNDGLHHVCAIEACLVVRGTIQKRQRQESALSDAIVVRRWGALDGNQNGEWWDVNDIEETAKVTGDTYIGASVDQVWGSSTRIVEADGGELIQMNTTDPGGADDMCNAIGR